MAKKRDIRLRQSSRVQIEQPVKQTLGKLIWEFMAKYGFHAAAFAAGCLIGAYNYVSNVATKPYVDEGVKSAFHYADLKTEQAKKESFDHSDRNHDDMLLRIEQMKGDLKGDLKEQNGKLDVLLDRLDNGRRRK